MGLFDGSSPTKRKGARSVLDEAREAPADDSPLTAALHQILTIGIDGRGPFDSAVTIAERAKAATASTEDAIDAVVRLHLQAGAASGFVTSAGGFLVILAAVPANLVTFYVLATRMVASVAHLRGYDVTDPEIRAAILLTLVASDSTAILNRVGVGLTGGTLSQLATTALPRTAAMTVQKAVAFVIMRGVARRSLAYLGRGVPLAGGAVGATLDWFMMRGIGVQARHEFPALGAHTV